MLTSQHRENRIFLGGKKVYFFCFFDVRPEDIVSKGGVIGFVGSSGRSSGPHLHFGVKVQDINVNPGSLIKLEL